MIETSAPQPVSLFENTEAAFWVLGDSAGNYSLWPASHKTPAGWLAAHGPASLDACRQWLERHWRTLSPAAQCTSKTGDEA